MSWDIYVLEFKTYRISRPIRRTFFLKNVT